jgi:hypothetical protein
MRLAKRTIAGDEMSQNATVQPRNSALPMPNSDRPEPAFDDTTAAEAKPASVALVPLAQTERRLRRRWYRWAPDPIFITHLIAEAQQVPQARRMRRASLADAQAAYQTRPSPVHDVGSRTRQTI